MEIFLKENIRRVIKELYNAEVNDDLIQIQETRKDFKGDFTLIVFPLLRFSKNTPEKTGEMIGSQLMDSSPEISGYNVIKGFLNIEISDKWWISYFAGMMAETDLLKNCRVKNPEVILVEYSSPNTNKGFQTLYSTSVYCSV